MEESKSVKPDFAKGGGLLPLIVQDVETNSVLMLAYMNEEAWEKTLETRKAHYWSRSRQKIWQKGETSGHTQDVVEILLDCDEDTILLRVHQRGGAACHTGYRSCFYRRIDGNRCVIVEPRIFDPEEVYRK